MTKVNVIVINEIYIIPKDYSKDIGETYHKNLMGVMKVAILLRSSGILRFRFWCSRNEDLFVFQSRWVMSVSTEVDT